MAIVSLITDAASDQKPTVVLLNRFGLSTKDGKIIDPKEETMSDSTNLSFTPSDEHKTLRDEILKRLEIRYQLVNLTLGSFAAILGVGFERHSELILFIYPVLAAWLAFAWQDNHNWMRLQISYIRRVLHGQWEERVEKHKEHYRRTRHKMPLGILSTSGIFLGTQFLAWLAGMSQMLLHSWNFINIGAAGISFSFIATTAYMFYVNRKDMEIYLESKETDSGISN